MDVGAHAQTQTLRYLNFTKVIKIASHPNQKQYDIFKGNP